MTPSAREPWLQEPEHPSEVPGFSLFMAIRSPTGEVGSWVGHMIPGTSGGGELPEDLRYRLLCFWFLAHLPDEALRETAESLNSLWDYYRVPFPSIPRLPAPPSRAVEIGPAYVRPAFQISED